MTMMMIVMHAFLHSVIADDDDDDRPRPEAVAAEKEISNNNNNNSRNLRGRSFRRSMVNESAAANASIFLIRRTQFIVTQTKAAAAPMQAVLDSRWW